MNHIFNKCYIQTSLDFNLEHIKKQDCIIFSDKFNFIDYFNTAMGVSNSLVAWKGDSILELIEKGVSVRRFVESLSEYQSEKDLLVFGSIEDICLIVLQTVKSLTDVDLKEFWRVCEKHYYPEFIPEDRLQFLMSLIVEPSDIDLKLLSPEFMYADFLANCNSVHKESFLDFLTFCYENQEKKDFKNKLFFHRDNFWKDDYYKEFLKTEEPKNSFDGKIKREWYDKINVVELNKHLLKFIEVKNGFEVYRRKM